MADLQGIRIWLSGALLGDHSEEDKRIRKFISKLTKSIFAAGGTIVHGCQEHLTPCLLGAASQYRQKTGNPARLEIFASKYFIDRPVKYPPINLTRAPEVCVRPVEFVPESAAENDEVRARQQSLAILRETISARCQSIVSVGGRWWEDDKSLAGVPKEIEQAQECGLPLFMVGGMGGAVAGLAKAKPEILRQCANGLTRAENESLTNESDSAMAAIRVVAQLQELPLKAINVADGRPFRILSLDGGGIRGAYTAAVLAHWEKALNLGKEHPKRIVDHFDLVAGTSTGAILAIGLALGMSAAEMKQFYIEKGPAIFGSGGMLSTAWSAVISLFTSRFRSDELQAQLEAAYSQSPVGQSGQPRGEWLSHSPARLLIPSYNDAIGKPFLFRSPYGRFQHTDVDRDPVEVALASAAAPTYFDPVQIDDEGARFLDGGVWANNPVAAAIGEATSELRIPLERIHVLSISTTHMSTNAGQPLMLPLNIEVKGLAGWASKIAGLLMTTQSQTADTMARQLLGKRYFRIDSESNYDDLGDTKSIKPLIQLGEDAASVAETIARVQATFLNGVAATAETLEEAE